MSNYRFVSDDGTCMVFSDGENRLRIQAISETCFRITQTHGNDFLLKSEPMIERPESCEGIALRMHKTSNGHLLSAGGLSIELSATGAIRYEADSALLTKEPEREGRWLRPIDIIKHTFDPDAPLVEEMSVDGARTRAKGVPYVDRQGYQAHIGFEFQEDEAIYGLGQHEEGILNYRGKHQFLYQHNLKVSCPVLVSSRGWAMLVNAGCAMTFHDDAYGSYLSCDAVDELDYFFFYGPEFDQIVAQIRALTGRAQMLPKWAFGYVQSKEHYHTQEELVDIVRKYREMKIPLDVVVQDWYTWVEGLWGQKTADESRYPDLESGTDEIHRMNAHVMWSIWPNMSRDGANRLEFLDKGLLLGNRSTYNAFDQAAREMYWKQANEGLFSKGVDAWWCDCTEPFEADWYGSYPMTPEDRMQFDVGEFKKYIDPVNINTYSIWHSRGIYEGQRKTTDEKRVINLTRSGFPGQQRYATITWNGDTIARWDVMKKSIADGLNFCLSGQPYWTMDVGGFFVKRWVQWFGHGEYEKGCDDPDYRELYLRWFQIGTFLPMLRSHGTDTPREAWQFGEEYQKMLVEMIELRMRLVPYIYSLAASAYFEDDTMLRMLAFDFRGDMVARTIDDQFMLGRALMVCPVTEQGAKSRRVYLPDGVAWYDFYTNERYEGGRYIDACAPLDKIPVFVKAGSILPMGPVKQYVSEPSNQPIEIRVYPGKDAEFTLYGDAGDGYGFERGEWAKLHMHWDEAEGGLKASREGDQKFLSENMQVVIVGGERT